MAEELALALGMLAALYGVADIIGRLAFRLLFSKKGGQQYLLVPLSGEQRDAEYIVRRLSATHRFFPSGAVRPLLVDCGMDAQSREVTGRVCAELQLSVCPQEELPEILSSGLQEP